MKKGSPELAWASAGARPKMNATDLAVLTVLQGQAIGGLASASHRWIAEQVGRTRQTVGKSIRRLRNQGMLTLVAGPRSTSISRFRVTNLTTTITNTPLSDTSRDWNVRQIFRSADLFGPGTLYENAPKNTPLCLAQIREVPPGRTRTTAKRQLQRLESLPIPLAVSAKDPGHAQRLLWTFPYLSETGEQEILERLNGLDAPYAPKPREELELQHSWERSQSYTALSLKSYPWVYEHDIAPNSLRDPETGCMVFMGPRNRNGYGMPVPRRPGIGAHRIAWIVHRGSVPPGYEINHKCGNPPCVDPVHLEALPVAEHRLITSVRNASKMGDLVQARPQKC